MVPGSRCSPGSPPRRRARLLAQRVPFREPTGQPRRSRAVVVASSSGSSARSSRPNCRAWSTDRSSSRTFASRVRAFAPDSASVMGLSAPPAAARRDFRAVAAESARSSVSPIRPPREAPRATREDRTERLCRSLAPRRGRREWRCLHQSSRGRSAGPRLRFGWRRRERTPAPTADRFRQQATERRQRERADTVTYCTRIG